MEENNPKKGNRLPIWIPLAVCGFILILSGSAQLFHLIFRKYIRILLKLTFTAGFLVFLIQMIQKIPENRRGLRVLSCLFTAVLAVFSAGMLGLSETDSESVVMLEGEKKIRTTSSFILYYEESYYDYGNAFFYRAFPCIRKSFDDGAKDQWIYTDFYDETGVFKDRIYAEDPVGK